MPARTLTEYLLDVVDADPGHDFAHIISAVQASVKLTAVMISRGALILDEAHISSHTPSAVHRARRRLATRTLLTQTAGLEQLAAISVAGVSHIYPVSTGPRARYLLVMEALHGALTLSENQTVGLAFSIFERPSTTGECGIEDFLQPGDLQVCAGIALYGPSTLLLLTTGRGVDGFTFDRELGSFVLSHPQLRIPDRSPVFAIDPSQAPLWTPPVQRYVSECIKGVDGPRGRDFTTRWSASAVVGAFRVLLNGGLFLAPRVDRRNVLWGLPLLHNSAPISMLIEQAGGAASTGCGRVLEVTPETLTDRVQTFFGNREEVRRIEDYFDEHAKGYDTEPCYPLFHQRTLFTQQ